MTRSCARAALLAAALVAAALPAPAAAIDPPHETYDGCKYCHVTHSGIFINRSQALCRSCHYSGGPAAEMANHECVEGVSGCRFTFGEGTASPVTCVDCHDPHSHQQDHVNGSTLGNYLRAKVRLPSWELRDVVLTTRIGTHSYADGDSTYDGLCEVCHAQTKYHRGDPSGDHSHFTADGCTACHWHERSFRRNSCVACHSDPQGSRRAVTSGGSGTPDFERASHHVETGPRNGDCARCHYYADHRSGTVNVRGPDDGAKIAYTTSAAVSLACAGCHDANGATNGGGTTPFTSGVAVPDIASLGFATSAHATGGSVSAGVGCFGLGTDGCHANGHGSSLPTLLAPFDAIPDGVAGEEGLCYRCHSAGQVSNQMISNAWIGGTYRNYGGDLQSVFGYASRHPVADSAPRHTFDAGGGPTELECTTCHGVHQDTGRYWAAPAGATPVVQPWTRAPFGVSPAEKIGAWNPAQVHVAPRVGSAGVDPSGVPLPVDGAGNSLLTGDVKPDYVGYCLSCHQVAFAGTRAIDWIASKHGAAAAEPSGTGVGFALGAPYVSASRGLYYLDCLDCHEAHGSQSVRLLRRSANGVAIAPILTAASEKDWMYLCETCHFPHAARHHNDDVWQVKLGRAGTFSDNCTTCHTGHSGSMYLSCMTAGCHGHGDFL